MLREVVDMLTAAVSAYGGHMDGDGTAWMWVVGPLMMVLLLALLGVLVWWLVGLANRRTEQTAAPVHPRAAAPEDIAAERYARGEIGAQEYRDIVANLRGHPDDSP